MTRPPAEQGGSRQDDLDRIRADRGVLEPVLEGDRTARAAFVDRFARLVYAVIVRTMRRYEARREVAGEARDDGVEDLFAEVFVALFDRDAQRLRQWTGRCSLATWVRLVAASVTVDRLRQERPRADDAHDVLPDALPSNGPAALELLVRAEELARVRRALESLPEGDRALLVAIYVDDVTPGALATRLGIAPGALYTRKSRALERLKEALAGEAEQDV